MTVRDNSQVWKNYLISNEYLWLNIYSKYMYTTFSDRSKDADHRSKDISKMKNLLDILSNPAKRSVLFVHHV